MVGECCCAVATDRLEDAAKPNFLIPKFSRVGWYKCNYLDVYESADSDVWARSCCRAWEEKRCMCKSCWTTGLPGSCDETPTRWTKTLARLGSFCAAASIHALPLSALVWPENRLVYWRADFKNYY